MTEPQPAKQHPLKRIRSFVRREGRFTRAQQHAFKEHWTTYGLEPEALRNLHRIFPRAAPVTLEIGFGNGLSLCEMAQREPQNNFLGIEVHRPGIGRLLNNAAANELRNLKVAQTDAAAAVTHHLPEQSLAHVLMLFPDPWPKLRHRKRRLFTAAFLTRLGFCMEPGAVLHLATDWQNYAQQMRQVIDADANFEMMPADHPWPCSETAFEVRGRQAGRTIARLSCRRISR